MLDAPKPAAKVTRDPKARDVEAILGIEPHPSWGLRRWRKGIWAAVAVLLAVGLFGWWSFGGSNAAVTYATEPAQRGSLTVIVTATGSAQPVTQVNVSSELSGIVRKVNVDFNSQVTSGQVLAELDTDKLEAAVESSRARLDSAKARVEAAAAAMEEKRAAYDRAQVLSPRGIVSTQDLDLAKANFDAAVAQHASALSDVKVAEADLRLDEINLAKACICSPIDGIVLERSVDPGQTVASSLQAPVLFVIAEDLSHMELWVDIDEADVGRIALGQKVVFGVDAYPGRKFPAELRDIRYGSEVVQGVVTYKAVLAIDNSELLIRPGMTATAEITVQEVEDALLAPNAALRFSPPATDEPSGGFLQRLFPMGRAFRPASNQEASGPDRRIWVLRESVPVAVPVTVGVSDGRMTEIVSGKISPGDAIIVDATSK